MASWKDSLRKASFRGVPFKVDSSDRTGGRRAQTFEFPGRDIPFTEDLGRKARNFSIEGFVLGDDYFKQRDALVTALEKEGAGTLVHPFYGNQEVQLTDFSVRETLTGEGRIARFQLSFVEAGKEIFPAAKADPKASLSTKAAAVRSAAGKKLGGLSVLRKPQFVIDDATAKVKAISDKMSSASRGADGPAAMIADLGYAIRKLNTSASELISSPADLHAQIDDALGVFGDAMGSVGKTFDNLASLLGFGSDDGIVTGSTPDRETQRENRALLNTHIQVMATSYAAEAAVEMDYPSVEEAEETRAILLDKLEEIAETADDDDLYIAMQDLRSEIVKGVPPEEESLPNVIEVELPEATPSLVLAYDTYESLDLEQDIVDRNRVQNPAFLPGRKPLKVLSRG